MEESLKKQIEMLRIRQQASRIALRLFESAKTQLEINGINHWFTICNATSDQKVLLDAIDELNKLAVQKGIPTTVRRFE